MAQDPYRYFRVEGRDLLEQMGRGVLELERGPSPELVARLLRLAHTLKGAARVVKQRELADRAHAFEDVLGPHRGGTDAVPPAHIDALLAHLDVMTGALALLDEPAPAATPEPARTPAGRAAAGAPLASTPASPPPATVPASARADDIPRASRPEVGELSELLEGIGEVHAQIEGLRKVAHLADEARVLAARFTDGRAVARSGDAPGTARGVRDAAEQPRALDELGQAIDRLRDGLVTGLDQLERETSQVREVAERMRLVPTDALFTALQRTVRDAAMMLGRRAAFHGSGGDVRMDPAALAAVQAALVQLARNAVAHGIESPEARRAAGKAPEGLISVVVERRRAELVFTCTDDGKGIDLEAVRRIARQKGLLTTESASGDELLALLVRGGISTSSDVTEVAGRGVGLDVAREAVADMGGSLTIRSQPGRGTSVALTVPALLAAVRALVVDSAGTTAAIPLDAVRGAVRVEPDDVARRPDGDSLTHDGRVIPLVPLAAALGIDRAPSRRAGRTSALVVEGRDGLRAAIAVDRLMGTATLVSRPLPSRAVASAVVAGAWMDAEGTPQLILDPVALVEHALRPVLRPVESETRRAPILVIDDSLTTRMLEQSILESAGYDVEVAASAEEGLEKAARTRYALFLVDIEMPGIDGFTFVERTRRDPVLREIPAILVSSRSAPEDLRRGMEVGAAAYVVKGDFDQGALLNRIRGLVG